MLYDLLLYLFHHLFLHDGSRFWINFGLMGTFLDFFTLFFVEIAVIMIMTRIFNLFIFAEIKRIYLFLPFLQSSFSSKQIYRFLVYWGFWLKLRFHFIFSLFFKLFFTILVKISVIVESLPRFWTLSWRKLSLRGQKIAAVWSLYVFVRHGWRFGG